MPENTETNVVTIENIPVFVVRPAVNNFSLVCLTRQKRCNYLSVDIISVMIYNSLSVEEMLNLSFISIKVRKGFVDFSNIIFCKGTSHCCVSVF